MSPSHRCIQTLKELSVQAGDAQTSTGGSTKPSDAGSGIVANLADLTKLGASATRQHI